MTVSEARPEVEDWREEYHQRPLHRGLGYLTPVLPGRPGQVCERLRLG